MIHKWIGALLTVAASTFCGFAAAASYRREERYLRQLIQVVEWMICQLQCRASNLSQLFIGGAQRCEGSLGQLFSDAASILDGHAAADVRCCMSQALAERLTLPRKTRQLLELLGASLGEFDLNGQLRQLESVKAECCRVLQEHTANSSGRERCCHTVGICVGFAIAILLI